MRIAIIIPTYNEAENIEKLLLTINQLALEDLVVLVIDDNSPDSTADIANDVASKLNYPLEVIRRKNKSGIGSAYVCGFSHAFEKGAEVLIQMDADLSHDPYDVPRLVAELATADLVIGSRRIPGGLIIGWGPIRKMMSGGAMLVSRFFLKLKTKDVTAGFRCFKKNVLLNIDLESIGSSGHAFQEEMLFRVERGGYTIKEIPVTFVDRREGKSKLTNKDILEFFVTIARLIKKK